MEMSTAAPLRIHSLSDSNPAAAQTLCGRPPTANSKRPMNTPRPTASVEEEQERFVDLVQMFHGRVLKVSLGLLLSDIRLLPLLR